jgi:hypothetical protein
MESKLVYRKVNEFFLCIRGEERKERGEQIIPNPLSIG